MKAHWFLITFVLTGLPLNAAELTGGISEFNDGDTFRIWGQSIRLIGIDAPEASQTCKDHQGREYHCGNFSARFLKQLTREKTITCIGDEMDQYDRLLAICYTDQIEINLEMVRSGWAIAFQKYDDRYANMEASAKAAKKGVWQGEFVQPADYRKKTWKKARQSMASKDKKCVIKGNINNKKDKIYHTPWGSKSYKKTKINIAKGEKWFCTEAEALNAGWRAPYR